MMEPESFDVRAADLGDGVFVAVATPSPEPIVAAPEDARAPNWSVTPTACVAAAAAGALAIGRIGLDPRGVFAAGVLAVLVVLAAIDLRWRLLPNRILVPALGAVLAYRVVFDTGSVVEGVVAALGAAALLLLPGLLQPGAVGMGDVKLAALLGATLGAEVLGALLIGFLLTAPASVYILLRHGARGRHRSLPMGPFLALGAAVVLLG
jgi:leader peptidase (prepilin peptidase) / N-methyltransferase